jgi:hypothetical protein
VTARGRRLLVGGVILLVLAAAAYGTLRLTYGERPAYVHVRWAATVDTAARERVERTHGLTRGALREGRTWGYSLTDLSSQNIRDLVGNPAVEDTHNIHRTAFRIWRTAPRDEYLSSRPAWIAATLEFLVPAFLVAGALALGVGLFQVKSEKSKVKSERAQATGSSHV